MTWQEKFKTSIANVENLYSKDSTDVSLLLFCLRAKMIPVQEYLNWAKENYQLPVLSEQYFKTYPPQKEFYKKWQKIYNWSPECLPVAEWDGALIIACLEVPTNYRNLNPTIFVLTSHEVLETAWTAYQKSEKAKINDVDFADMTALAATVVAPSQKEEKSFFDEDGELILQDHSSEEPEEISKLSEEGSHNEDKTPLDLSGENEAGASPEGLFLEASPPKSSSLLADISKLSTLQAQDTKPGENPPVVAAEETRPRKGPRTSVPVMNIEMGSVGDKTRIDNIDELEEIPDHEVPMPDKMIISPMDQVSVGEVPQAPVKPTTPATGSAAYLLEKIRKQGQGNFDKETTACFQRLKTFFKKSMLLAIGDKDRLVKPLMWDDNFDNPNPTTTEFNLNTPSIFKIVTGTQKPYHGFVTVNDLNESFFESWNHGQIPDHVTIVPLLDGDLLVGMLMGFGEKSSYNKNVLQFTESVAKELSQKLLKPSAQKAAA